MWVQYTVLLILLSAQIRTVQNYEQRKTNKLLNPFLGGFEKVHENQHIKCQTVSSKNQTKPKDRSTYLIQVFYLNL